MFGGMLNKLGFSQTPGHREFVRYTEAKKLSPVQDLTATGQEFSVCLRVVMFEDSVGKSLRSRFVALYKLGVVAIINSDWSLALW